MADNESDEGLGLDFRVVEKKGKKARYVDPWRVTGTVPFDMEALELQDGHLVMKAPPKDESTIGHSSAAEKDRDDQSMNSFDQPVIVMTANRLDHSRPLVALRFLLDATAIICHVFSYIVLPDGEFWLLRLLRNSVFYAAVVAPSITTFFLVHVLYNNTMNPTGNKFLGVFDLLIRTIVVIALLFEIDSAFDWYGRIITVEYDDPASGDGFNISQLDNMNVGNSTIDSLCCTDDAVILFFTNMIITFILTFLAYLYAIYYFYVEFLCMELQESLFCICCKKITPIFGEL